MEYIFQNCVIAVAARGDEPDGEIGRKAELLKKRYQADIRLLSERRIDISSLEIRERLQKGQSVRYLLPDSVLAYIAREGLYQS